MADRKMLHRGGCFSQHDHSCTYTSNRCTDVVTLSTVFQCTMSKTKRIITSNVCISRIASLLACETQALSVFVCPCIWFVFHGWKALVVCTISCLSLSTGFCIYRSKTLPYCLFMRVCFQCVLVIWFTSTRSSNAYKRKKKGVFLIIYNTAELLRHRKTTQKLVGIKSQYL